MYFFFFLVLNGTAAASTTTLRLHDTKPNLEALHALVGWRYSYYAITIHAFSHPLIRIGGL